MENYNQLIDVKDLQKKIDEGYELSIKSILTQTFAHFKKDVGKYVLLFLVFLVLVIASMLTIIGPILIAFPLVVGFSYAALKADMGKEIELGDLFKGFDKFGPLVLLMLMLMALMAFLFIPFYAMMWQYGLYEPGALAKGTEIPAIFGGWYFFSLIISLLINASLIFAPYLIFYGDFSPMAAVRTSWDLAKQNLLKLVVLIFLLGLISMMGIVIFGFGILFSIPLSYVGYYILIKNVLFAQQ